MFPDPLLTLNVAEVVIGEDIAFPTVVPPFELVSAWSPQVRCHVNIDRSINVSECILQLLLQLHPEVPSIAVNHMERLLDCFAAVIQQCDQHIISPQVGDGARGEVFVLSDDIDNVS